ARGVNPRPSLRVFVENKSAEPSFRQRTSRVVEIDRVGLPGPQRLRKIHEHRSRVALILQRRLAKKDLVNLERVVEVKLNARPILQHLEANRILAADRLCVRINTNIQVVIQQIVIGSIRPISAAQYIGPGRQIRLSGARHSSLRGSRQDGDKKQESDGWNVLEHDVTSLSRFRKNRIRNLPPPRPGR